MLPIKNYLRLGPELGSAGQPDQAQLSWIAEEGFQAVINLGLPDADYALPDEGAVVQELGMLYIHIPVLWESPKRTDLDAFMDTMDGLQGKQVFVHCAANMRASVFLALYRILRLDWDRSQALQWINHIWQPDPIWQAFIDEQLAS